MKLKLKHIAPYLPHSIGIQSFTDDAIGESYVLHPYKDTLFTLEDNKHISIANLITELEDNADHRLILRPLSDLNKEIEIKGKLFNPFEKLGFIGCKVKGGYIVNNNGHGFKITGSSYKNVQKLFEWHFDVFGLIDEGLAIDVNTLKK